MKFDIHKKEQDYMKMVQLKRLLVLLNQSYEHFPEVTVSGNDL